MPYSSVLDRKFKRGSKKSRVTVYLNEPIAKALDEVSEKSGENISEIICDVLDQYLTELLKRGLVSLPVEEPKPKKEKSK
jgi:hypothetical protein